MDALAEFTAMSPPRDGETVDGPLRRRRSLQDSSAASLDESFSSSQCSADPSAFVNLQGGPGASLARFPSSALLAGRGEKRVRLSLTLKAATGVDASTAPPLSGPEDSQTMGGSYFTDFFSGDTQDDGGRDGSSGLSGKKSPTVASTIQRDGQLKQARRPTPPSLLASIESAWMQRKRTKQPVDCPVPIAATLSDEASSSPPPPAEAEVSPRGSQGPRIDNDRRSSIPGSPQYSEDLVQFESNAARIPPLSSRRPAAERSSSKETMAARTIAVVKQRQPTLIPERSSDEDEDANTEGFDNGHFAAKVSLQASKAATEEAVDDVDTYSDTGTEPYVPSDDDGDAEMDEEDPEMFPEAGASSVKSVDGVVANGVVANGGVANGGVANDDLVSGGESSSAAAMTTPATKTCEDSKLDSSAFPIASANSESQSQAPASSGLSVEEDDEEEDESYPPTQPSKAFYSQPTSKPVEEEPPIVVPPKVALKKRGKVVSTDQSTLTDSQEHAYELAGSECQCGSSSCRCDAKRVAGAKSSAAIRNLEFSFAMPESQDSQSQQSESVPDIDKLASKALHSLRDEVDGDGALENCIRGDKTAASKKTAPSNISRSLQPTPKKAKMATSPAVFAPQTPVHEASQQSMEATPNRKRKRVSTPSRSTQDDPESSGALTNSSEVTPSRPPRHSSRRSISNASASSTPSSSQKVRTRPKDLSPLPSNRAYLSRSRTIFKFKFVFVVTGFTSKGKEIMVDQIRDYGGKVAKREQDVLYRGNINVVVIATPAAWRKLKFMQAVACGIPVVHPEWIHECIKASSVQPFEGYTVPSGYSISTRKFECRPVKQLSVFSGYTYGIVTDISDPSTQPKEMVHLVAMTLRACGAYEVHENLTTADDVEVDIVLCSEYTKTCKYYAAKLGKPVKNFSWVTECVILQEFVEPNECDFEPPQEDQDTVLWANAVIGDVEHSTLKLQVGELILADLARSEIDHTLVFHVCEILDIFLVRDNAQAGGRSGRRRRAEEGLMVVLRVGVLKRHPRSAGVSRRPSRVLETPSNLVKRRVVAVSKADYDTLKYCDEGIFFFEDEGESSSSPDTVN